MSFELAGSQKLTQDQILSTNAGRDATEPYLDGVQMVAGDVKVPIDNGAFRQVARPMLLGSATTTGTAPNYISVFASGALVIPTRSFEKAFPTDRQVLRRHRCPGEHHDDRRNANGRFGSDLRHDGPGRRGRR